MQNLLPTVPLIGALAPSTGQARQGKAIRVTVCTGPDVGRVFDLGKDVLVVGRGHGVDICLLDPAVSQFHCSLKLTADGVVIRDLSSKNGIWVSGLKIELATVPLGTVLSVGSSTLRVDLGMADATAAERRASFGRLVGKSDCMQRLYAQLARLAPTNLSVLIEGETGTGKEGIARSLFEQSSRSKRPWVVVDCANLPESLATSLLFGHEKGAFSGATEKRLGQFQAAHGGCLFLDEVGELQPAVQAMLLRAVQEREIKPLGAVREQPVDVRIFCATKRDLRSLVNSGRFREDLYYRLAESTVVAPALRERLDDIPLLIEHFLEQIPRNDRAARTFAPDVVEALQQTEYGGNVRELRTLVFRLAQLAEGATVTMADLSMDRLSSGLRSQPEPTRRSESVASDPPGLEPGVGLYHEARKTVLDDFEKAYCVRVMSLADGNLSRAAARAGIERQNLRSLLRKHGLYVPPSEKP